MFIYIRKSESAKLGYVTIPMNSINHFRTFTNLWAATVNTNIIAGYVTNCTTI